MSRVIVGSVLGFAGLLVLVNGAVIALWSFSGIGDNIVVYFVVGAVLLVLGLIIGYPRRGS